MEKVRSWTGEFNQEAALRIYYSKPEITKKDIAEIFGCAPNGARAQKFKKIALVYMAEQNLDPWDSRSVNTRYSYKAWGIDIVQLEKSYLKMKKLFGN